MRIRNEFLQKPVCDRFEAKAERLPAIIPENGRSTDPRMLKRDSCPVWATRAAPSGFCRPQKHEHCISTRRSTGFRRPSTRSRPADIQPQCQAITATVSKPWL